MGFIKGNDSLARTVKNINDETGISRLSISPNIQASSDVSTDTLIDPNEYDIFKIENTISPDDVYVRLQSGSYIGQIVYMMNSLSNAHPASAVVRVEYERPFGTSVNWHVVPVANIVAFIWSGNCWRYY